MTLNVFWYLYTFVFMTLLVLKNKIYQQIWKKWFLSSWGGWGWTRHFCVESYFVYNQALLCRTVFFVCFVFLFFCRTSVIILVPALDTCFWHTSPHVATRHKLHHHCANRCRSINSCSVGDKIRHFSPSHLFMRGFYYFQLSLGDRTLYKMVSKIMKNLAWLWGWKIRLFIYSTNKNFNKMNKTSLAGITDRWPVAMKQLGKIWVI